MMASETEFLQQVRAAGDHVAARKSDGNRGTDRHLRGGGSRGGAASLPVAEERDEHARGNLGKLHNPGDNRVR